MCSGEEDWRGEVPSSSHHIEGKYNQHNSFRLVSTSITWLMYCLSGFATIKSLFFFKYKFIYFNWRLITLQYCIGFAIHQHESSMVYMCSPSWTPVPPPSPDHSSGSSQCTSSEHPVSDLDWWFILHMIIYMFQCHSPKSSHPLPLPQSPKDCSIHLCLFCCLAYRVSITIFLNSIYMC